ncbi:MAG: CHASE2 domain-containing protein [Nitrospirae bacterium]|nr:CHASE2 domain-containing protein [Nitrospirota bacterium]
MEKLTEFFKARILKLTGFRVSFIITLLILVAYVLQVPFLERLELLTYDARLAQRKKIDVGNEAVLATIDEKALEELGRWPWPRNRMGQVIEKLNELGSKVIGIDAIFAERDSSFKILEEFMPYFSGNPILVQKVREADRDLALAETLKHQKNVVLGYVFDFEARDDPEVLRQQLEIMSPAQIQTVTRQPDSPLDAGPEALSVIPNLDMFSKNANYFGHFNMDNDPQDGTLRWYPLVVRAQDEYYPALGLQLAAVVLDASLGVELDSQGIKYVHLFKKGTLEKLRTIPVDANGRMLLNYVGRGRTFEHIGLADVVAGRVDRKKFEGAAVLIGATAQGLWDLRVTPLDEKFPGTEVHATVISNILHNDYVRRPRWYRLMDMGVIVFTGLVLGNILQRVSAVWGFLGLFVIGLAYYFVNLQVFVRQGVWISMAYPMGSMAIVFLGVTVYRYVSEEREKKKIKGAFQSYLDPAVVAQVTENPDMLKLGGERIEMTVLFSDVRSFTTISEKLTPESLVKLLNTYLSPMTDLVFKHQGTLDKYMGDAIMAFFGAPIHYPDHAEKACDTALEMMSKLVEMQPQLEAEGFPRLDIGIGLNSGPMSVGNMGSNTRFNYTVMGDAVNLGSRLEGTNKEYGTHIIISEFTQARVDGKYITRELDFARVKGKKEPIKIYELVARKDGADPAKLGYIEEFNKGLNLYRKREFDRAIEAFNNVLKMKPDDRCSSIYIERAHELKQSPPPEGWDGVYVFTHK